MVIINEQLYTLIIVAETGSFSKAAEKLYVSAPAVIKQMNQLENKVGCQLFKRTHHGVSLTAAGKIIYQDAKILIPHFDETVKEAKRAAHPESTNFRIGTSAFKPYQPFMPLWDECHDAFPGYSLQIIPFNDDHNTITSVVESLGKRFDLLVAACNSKTWLKQVSFLKLWDDPFVAAVPNTHPLASAKTITAEMLKGEKVYLFEKGDAPSIDVLWDYYTKFPDIELIPTGYYDLELFNQAISENRIIISIASWSHVHPSFLSIPLDINYTTPYGILYAKDTTPQVRQLIHILESTKKDRKP